MSSERYVVIPDIGDPITPLHGADLCEFFGMPQLAERVRRNPHKYVTFCFDGVSGINSKWFCDVFSYDYDIIVRKCALTHDLRYAYGKLGSDIEKVYADNELYYNLIHYGGMSKTMAMIFYTSVRMFGGESRDLSYSWGFAHKGKKIKDKFQCSHRDIKLIK